MDAPTPWGLFFQDSASPQMEGIEELHNNIITQIYESWYFNRINMNYFTSIYTNIDSIPII
ncbi:hypothetical protein N7461_009636 (mitochondrion) [Penicillium sp. DV-2018c]|nr:hypothetical protein N7461_009636 [Penicillium sp. DV-2018c]